MAAHESNQREEVSDGMPEELKDFSRLCVHTMTTKPLSLPEAIEAYVEAEVAGITVWRQHIEPHGAKEAGRMLRESGLEVVSLCRGGFFVAAGAREREEARTENRRIIDEAAEIGAPLVVLVCGASPEVPLPVARQQIVDSIHAIEPHAKAAGVKLAIEPLHPMYAGDRSAVNTLEQANNMCYALRSDWVGVAVDVYHLWWDPFLRAELERTREHLFAFHVCDWRVPTRDMLNDRGLMGEGCIKVRDIRGWVEQAGFTGFIEVEIFSDEYWGMDQRRYLRKIRNAYREYT